MDYVMVAERVTAKVAGRGKEYRKYFDKMLKKWDVKSPAEIPDDKKDDFFEEVDKGWNSADEKGKDGKKTAAVRVKEIKDRKGHCWVYDAGEYSGRLQEIEGPGIPLYRIMVSFPNGEVYKHRNQVKDFGKADKILRTTLKNLESDDSVILRDWKVASLVSLRDRKAGCEKLPEGPMRDNCEKKKDEKDDDKEDDDK